MSKDLKVSQAGKVLLAAQFPKIRLNVHVFKEVIHQITLEYAPALQLSIQTQENTSAIEKQLLAWLVAYGKKDPFPIADLPLVYPGSFMGNAWKALADIPFGEVRTYQEIAVQLNNPRASRAVGTSCRRNPYPILVPCHRVLPKGACGVGNFAFGSSMKESLLNFERGNS